MRFLLWGLLALGCAPLFAQENLHKLNGKAQGSTWKVIYGGKEQPDMLAAIEKELANFDKVFSNYRPDSDISRFNQQTATDWFPVDADLVRLVELSRSISEKSQGAFDITIGPLLRAWGFGPFRSKNPGIPTDAAIGAAKKDVDYRQLLTRQNPPALKKLNPNLYADLSGIAQGYSVDHIATFIEKRGVNQYLVEIGGEVKTKGTKGPGKPWTLGIDAPTAASGEVAALLHVEGRGLTTAGDYREYFEKDGKRFSHTLDPRTGRPVAHNLASVTVMAETAWEADGWDTALMVLGPEATRKLVPNLKTLAVYLILREGPGFRTESLGGFDKFISVDSRR